MEMKISEITPQSREVTLAFKVLNATETREVTLKTDGSQHRVCDFTVGDDSGVVRLTAWDAQIEQLQVGKVYEIKNGYVKLFKGHIQLNVGKKGTLGESSAAIETVNESNDVSAAEHEDDYRPRGGGYGGGGYGGGRRGGYGNY